MKKLLLLLAAGVISGSSFAQVANVHSRVLREDGAVIPVTKKITPKSIRTKSNVASKTTSAASGEWFDFFAANYETGGTNTAGLIPSYPDSNLLVTPTTGSPFHWWNHGLGVSFDPKSLYYSSLYLGTTGAPSFVVTTADAYTIDSIEIVGFYNRYKNYTDTLFIEIVSADDTGAYNVIWSDPTIFSDGMSEDSSLRASVPHYNYINNNISSAYTPHVKTITKILDAAAYADTTAEGFHDWIFEVPGGLSVPAGNNVVVYSHFGSGHTYPLNTALDSANYWRNLSYDFGRSALQKKGDNSCGITASTDDRYHTSSAMTLGTSGIPILTPTYFYTAPISVHNPYFSLHLKCPTCYNVGVNNTNVNVSSIKAYPNPAADQVTVDFTMVKATDVTVSIYNIAGQVVATSSVKNAANGKVSFDTKNIPAGSYIYAVDADGSRNTGRINVAH